MAYRRVRIYTGNDKESDVVGFSLSAANAPDNPLFDQFLDERGYMREDIKGGWEEVEDSGGRWAWALPGKVPEHGVSWRYVEIKPRLSEEHIIELGALCVGQTLDGERAEGIVDPYHDGILVYDNRLKKPDGPYGGGHLIAHQM